MNLPPGGFDVTTTVAGTTATLKWTDAIDPEGGRVTYSILLNDELVIDNLQSNEFTLDHLDYSFNYAGKIIASDPQTNTVSTLFSLQTGEISIEWQASFGDRGTDRIHSMDETIDGSYVFTGYSSEGSIDKGNGSDDFRLLKLDVPGNNGFQDFWVLKLDNSGSILGSENMGGDRQEIAHNAQPTHDGGFIVVGSSESSETGDVKGVNNGNSDFWVTRLNSTLEIVWENNFGTPIFDQALSVLQTPEGNYVVAGNSQSFDNDIILSSQGWILELNQSGTVKQEVKVDNSGLAAICDIKPTSDGGYVAVGYSISNNNGSADYLVVKLDASLVEQWSRNFGGSNKEEATSVYPTKNGGFLVAGSSASSDIDVGANHGGNDFWIVKIDAHGDLVWEKNLGGTNDDGASSVMETTDGGVIAAGHSISNDGDVLSNEGSSDFWVVKLK